MSELPNGWTHTRLGTVCSKPQYGWTSRASREGRIKYLRTTDISSGEINWDNVPFCEIEPDDIEKFRIHEDDVFVSRAGSVGVSFRIKEVPYEAVFASYLIRFTSLEAVLPQYIECFLKSQDYWRSISELSAGIAVPNINASKLAELEIPLPPLNEQRCIVAKLEKLLSRVEAAQARLSTIPRILKRFRESVLAAACCGNLTADWRQTGRVSDYYEPTTIGEVADYVGGFAYRSTTFTESGSNQVVRIGNVRPFSLKLEASPVFIPDEIAKTTERFRLAPDDIVVSMTGTKYKKDYGYAAIVTGTEKKLFLNQRVSRLRCNEKVLSPFLLYWLQTHTFKDFFFEGETGNVNQGNVGADGIRKAPIELPSLPEQHEIVRRVQALFKTADALEARYRTAKAHVDKLTQSILARAFRGKLVPQDPNDEPASILLERIRAARTLRHDSPKKLKRKASITPKRTEVTMLKPEEIQHSHLSDILKDHGPLSPEALWNESQLEIDDFYEQLKLEETRGFLKETSNDASRASRLLEAA